jgi:hypothetical protein
VCCHLLSGQCYGRCRRCFGQGAGTGSSTGSGAGTAAPWRRCTQGICCPCRRCLGRIWHIHHRTLAHGGVLQVGVKGRGSSSQ